MNARLIAAMNARRAAGKPIRQIDMRPHPYAHRSWLTRVAQWATPERADWIVAAMCLIGLACVVVGYLVGLAMESL